MSMQNDPAKRNNFITNRLASYIVRDCGTGAGGFQAGNSCAKGGDGGDDDEKVDKDGNFIKPKPDYAAWEKETKVPASLLETGILDIEGIQDAKVYFGGDRIQSDSDLEEIDVGISSLAVPTAVYRYNIEGTEGDNYQLRVSLDFDESDTGSDGIACNIIFSINGHTDPTDDENIKGQGSKIFRAVEMSITHLMKVAPSVEEFTFQGSGAGRTGIAREMLYRRLATKIAKTKGGKVNEMSRQYKNNGKNYTITEFAIEAVSSSGRSVRAAEGKRIAIFTYTYEPALVDPTEDEAEQKFWGLNKKEERDCGTGAGGFKSGNDCAKGGGEGSDSGVISKNPRYTSGTKIPPNAGADFLKNTHDQQVADIMRTKFHSSFEKRLLANAKEIHDSQQAYMKDMNAENLGKISKAHEKYVRTLEGLPPDQVKELMNREADSFREFMDQKGFKVPKDNAKLNKIEDVLSRKEVMLGVASLEQISERGIWSKGKPLELVMSKSGDKECAKLKASGFFNRDGRLVLASDLPNLSQVPKSYADHSCAAVTTHELMHAMHFKQSQSMYTKFPRSEWVMSNKQLALHKDLQNTNASAYGKTSIQEYVATCATRFMRGEKLSKQEWDVYDRCGGPKIQAKARKRLTR